MKSVLWVCWNIFLFSSKINLQGFELFRNITTFAALKMGVIQFLKEI